MATGWTDITSGSGGGGEIQGDVDDVGADGFFEPVRASLIACAHGYFSFGGSRTQAITTVTPTWEEVLDYFDFVVPAAKEGGFTYTAEVELIVENASTSITARLRNITDSTTLFTGAAVTATTWARQSTVFVPVAGKVYRLQVQRSNNSYNAWAIGWAVRTEG